METSQSTSSGFSPSTGVYYSKWKIPDFPQDLILDLPSFLLSLPHDSCKPAFIDDKTGAQITYYDLHSLTNKIASSLIALGAKQGDIILIISPNFLYYPLLILAIMSIGAIVSTANPLNVRDEIVAQITDSHPTLIFTTQDLKPKLDGLVLQNSLEPLIILLEAFLHDFLAGTCNASSPQKRVLLKSTEAILNDNQVQENSSLETTKAVVRQNHKLQCNQFKGIISKNHTAMLAYSSGTTGRSKGVKCTHGNFISMACMLKEVWGTRHDVDEVYMCVLPLFHMYGLSVFVIGVLATGATAVIARKYALEDMLRCIDSYKVTRLPVVPPMLVQLLRSPLGSKYELSSLKEVSSSGATLRRESILKFTKIYPHVTLTQCYGLTETSGLVTLWDGVLDGRFCHESIGCLAPSVEARVVDLTSGEWLPPGRSGELWLRGPITMQGYFKNKEATSHTIDREGWVHTGDVCVIDKHGLVYIVGRIKELIKYKAYQVAPVELEEILCKHEAIQDCAVIPYPNEEAGEIPMACIVGKAARNLKEEDIINYMTSKVAPYKKIRKVIFVEHIPRSPSGKILRRNLMALADQLLHQLSSRL